VLGTSNISLSTKLQTLRLLRCILPPKLALWHFCQAQKSQAKFLTRSKEGNKVITKGTSTNQIKKAVGTVFLAIMVVINMSLCIVMAYSLVAPFLFFSLPETEITIDRIDLEGREVVLTCTAQHSGPIILTLKSCPVDNTELCEAIDTIYESGTPCQEYRLGTNTNTNTVTIETGSDSILRTYNSDEFTWAVK
jgi:hypothetical protein